MHIYIHIPACPKDLPDVSLSEDKDKLLVKCVCFNRTVTYIYMSICIYINR